MLRAQVAAGYEHADQVHADAKRHAAGILNGDVFSCGRGDLLGHGTRKDKQKPTVIEKLLGIPIRRVWTPDECCFVQVQEGHLYSWGRGLAGQLGHMGTVKMALPTQVNFSELDDCIDLRYGLPPACTVRLSPQLSAFN